MIVKNAGIPYVRSSKSISFIMESIKNPTTIRAGAIAKRGT